MHVQLHSCSSSYSNHRVRHLSYCKSPHGQDANAHVLLRLSVATPCRSTHSCACCQMPSERSCDGACCCLCLLAIHVMSATTLCMCSVKPLRSVCLFACVAELRGCGTPELWCRSAGNWCVRQAVATPHRLWCGVLIRTPLLSACAPSHGQSPVLSGPGSYSAPGHTTASGPKRPHICW